MKKLTFLFIISTIAYIYACSPTLKELEEKRIADSIRIADSLSMLMEGQQISSGSNDVFSSANESGNTIEPQNRDITYYKSKGFQVFPQYHLAVKCPVLLTDISNKSKANFDLHYGGVENDANFYELIIFDLPLGYRDLSADEKTKFEIKFLSDKFPGKTVITEMGGKVISAKVMEYSHQQGQGKGFAFIFEGKVFAFNVIAKTGVSEKFNTLTNNIIFYIDPTSSKLSGPPPVDIIKQKSPVAQNRSNQSISNTSKPSGSSTKQAAVSHKSVPKIVCVNCSEYEVKFRNYKWETHYDSNKLCLESFSILNLSAKIIWSIDVKFTVYDSEGIPVDSGTFNRSGLKIDSNSAKIVYSDCFVGKSGSQTVKLEIISVDSK